MRPISSRHNPLISEFRELAARPDPAGARVFLDGAHLVHEAIDAGLAFEAAVVTSDKLTHATEEAHLASVLESKGVDVLSADARVFDAVSPTKQPSGLAAIALRSPSTPEAFVHSGRALVLVAAELQDPGNVGALIRVAEAGGATGVVVTTGTANPFSWKALRGSMGSALRLPVVTGLDMDAVLAMLGERGFASVAAVARSGADPDELDWNGRLALWVGSEGHGLPTSIVRRCAQRVAIPMTERVESLNVAVAAGVLVYAARRHRA
jgi:TrmH family RNA methyltransferase